MLPLSVMAGGKADVSRPREDGGAGNAPLERMAEKLRRRGPEEARHQPERGTINDRIRSASDGVAGL